MNRYSYPPLGQAALRARRAARLAAHEAHARAALVAGIIRRSERGLPSPPSGAERLAQVRRTIAGVASSRND